MEATITTNSGTSIDQVYADAQQAYARGDLAGAELLLQSVLQQGSSNPQVLVDLGCVREELGRYEDAIKAFESAVALAPKSPAIFEKLGACALKCGRKNEALNHYQHSLQLDSQRHGNWHSLGKALMSLGQYVEAEQCFAQAARLDPSVTEYHLGRCAALVNLCRYDDALESAVTATNLSPQSTNVWMTLGAIYRDMARIEESKACIEKVLELNPDSAEAHNSMGLLLRTVGQCLNGIQWLQRAVELSPNNARFRSDYIYALQFKSGITLRDINIASAEWDELHGSTNAATPRLVNTADPHRQVRVGLCSTGFGQHPVGFFTLTTIERLNGDQFAFYAYADGAQRDSYTQRFLNAVHDFNDVRFRSHAQLLELIRQDNIDVLIDMTGHLGSNRLPVFAQKAAPIQMKWVGYAGSTGLRTMDCIIGDRFHIPERLEDQYVEQVVRMPNGYICYDPPVYAPEPGLSPATERGYPTFCSTCTPAKYMPEVIATWSSILNKIPRSRMRLQFKFMDSPLVKAHILSQFESCGIDSGRIDIYGGVKHQDFLKCFSDVDIVLDTFPFSGGVSTCEALWCGVPVITMPGETFASRHSLSHVTNAGFPEFVVNDPHEYIEKVVQLATDVRRLSELRATMRARMAASPLCDADQFARDFGDALRECWIQWCAEQRGTT